MKRFSITYLEIIIKQKKNKGANEVPQLKPEMQSELVFIVSYISIPQSSPLEILKSSKSADPKFLKFEY